MTGGGMKTAAEQLAAGLVPIVENADEPAHELATVIVEAIRLSGTEAFDAADLISDVALILRRTSSQLHDAAAAAAEMARQ